MGWSFENTVRPTRVLADAQITKHNVATFIASQGLNQTTPVRPQVNPTIRGTTSETPYESQENQKPDVDLGWQR